VIFATLAVAGMLQAALPTGSVRGLVQPMVGHPQETVVYLIPEVAAGKVAPGDSVIIDQRELRFVPRVVAIPTGTVVRFRNSDPVLHNVFSPPRIGADFNLGMYPRPESREAVFNEPGLKVILCHVHPEMVAYVLVVPTRLIAIPDQNGEFLFAAVPPGRYRIMAWRPRTPQVERMVEVTAGGTVRTELELARRRRED